MLWEVTLICVGNLKKRYLKELEKMYVDNIRIINVKDSDSKNESKEILKILDRYVNKFCVLFDLNGDRVESFSKLKDSKLLIDKSLFFIVGGSHGVSESLRKYCNKVIKLSDFTYSHQIFRISSLIFIRNILFNLL